MLENSDFYGGRKNEFRQNKIGRLSHRELLRRAIDEAVENSSSNRDFRLYMERLGFSHPRGDDYKHPTWIAADWQRPVRMDSLGKGYSKDEVIDRIQNNDPD